VLARLGTETVREVDGTAGGAIVAGGDGLESAMRNWRCGRGSRRVLPRPGPVLFSSLCHDEVNWSAASGDDACSLRRAASGSVGGEIVDDFDLLHSGISVCGPLSLA
jgi:hypothetical protein